MRWSTRTRRSRLAVCPERRRPAHGQDVKPASGRVYAWAHKTDDPNKPKWHVAVLHVHPVTSPELAVRAAIVQEFKLGTAQEA